MSSVHSPGGPEDLGHMAQEWGRGPSSVPPSLVSPEPLLGLAKKPDSVRPWTPTHSGPGQAVATCSPRVGSGLWPVLPLRRRAATHMFTSLQRLLPPPPTAATAATAGLPQYLKLMEFPARVCLILPLVSLPSTPVLPSLPQGRASSEIWRLLPLRTGWLPLPHSTRGAPGFLPPSLPPPCKECKRTWRTWWSDGAQAVPPPKH